jgi:hypothetical protein
MLVDVEIAGAHAVDDALDGLVDAAVHAERQSVTCRANVREQRVEGFAAEAHDVQHGSEHLALQGPDAVELDERRRDEGLGGGVLR